MKISIYGKARSGKTTVADYLKKRYGFASFSFGSKVKSIYHEIFGKTDGKDREGYQWFGQLMRQKDPDVWIKHVDPLIRRGIEKGWNIVIDDMRQPNEFEYLKSLGFVMVKIYCPSEIRLDRMQKAGDILPEGRLNLIEVLNHETERHIHDFDYDYCIDNSGSLDSLFKQIENIIEKIKVGAE